MLAKAIDISLNSEPAEINLANCWKFGQNYENSSCEHPAKKSVVCFMTVGSRRKYFKKISPVLNTLTSN